MAAAANLVGLTGCLSDGRPLADYEAWLRNNGYLADPDVNAADVAATDTGLSDTDPTVDGAAADASAPQDLDPTADMGSVNGCPVRAAGSTCSAQNGMAVSSACGCWRAH